MDESEYDPVQTNDNLEPRWLNQAIRCSFQGATGIELGYILAGRGAASGMWFSFLPRINGALIASGMCDREAAKHVVEEFFWLDCEAEEHLSNNRRKPPKRE